ncbi:NADH dehydrogenase [ubiquinone] 1 alpha subcomplex subunit 9, mitochondrial-like [Oscarella lobularis]|uniref:NADH dehydrogenase [ubiquinone] 1 alpha subcomplex subunit 9, mitochondrial-like n=1 Tax=Oscarella lobularis TaxID=121494 RepID=UPI003313EEF3
MATTRFCGVIARRNASWLSKTGRGGRSSFSGEVVTVFGATGFVGRYIVNRLGRCGTQLIIPYRGDDHDTRHLKLMGDLGQVHMIPYGLKDEKSVREAVRHSDKVVNLIGRDFETRRFSFDDALNCGARTIARASKEAGIERLVHVSALNASPDSPSKFLRAKFAGEEAVREEFPQATIMRPSNIVGREDRFFNYYANFRMLPFLLKGVPLQRGRLDAQKQPVFVADVTSAIFNALDDAGTAGKTFELVGSDVFALYDLIEYIYKVMKRPFKPYTLPKSLYSLIAFALEMSPFDPYLTRDILLRQHLSDTLTPNTPGLEDLGVDPMPIEEVALSVLRRHRDFFHFNESLDDIHT